MGLVYNRKDSNENAGKSIVFNLELVQKQVLVTGANGQLGSEIKRASAFHPANLLFHFADVAELDITNPTDVENYIAHHKIDYIVNCAAYTAVDKAEDDIERCYLINRDAVKNLAESAARHKAKVIHVSTDYVFDGMGTRPYRETDAVNPQSVYGKSKCEGEKLLQSICPDSIIIRTAWLYSVFGNNFVKTMIRLGQERDSLNVVADQQGTPTNAADLADAILKIINYTEASGDFKSGIYHYTNEGESTWYDFTVAIHELKGITTCRVNPITTEEYPTPAARPKYSILDKTKIKEIFGIRIPEWKASLQQVVDEL
ncbi:MAG: dTDP-4-dehydrorhamnose reductase [Dysgonamonadaceae bacterium]